MSKLRIKLKWLARSSLAAGKQLAVVPTVLQAAPKSAKPAITPSRASLPPQPKRYASQQRQTCTIGENSILECLV
jgi:hypothetical protein